MIEGAKTLLKDKLNKKIFIAIAPFLFQALAFLVIILVILAPIYAAKEWVEEAGNNAQRFWNFITFRGWNTNEERYHSIIANMPCEDAKIITATIMYYYQWHGQLSQEELGDDSNSEEIIDVDEIPYGKLYSDAKKLKKRVSNEFEYEKYVKEDLFKNEPYSKLFEDEPDEDKAIDEAYKEIKMRSTTVPCESTRGNQVCVGNYSESGTAEIDLKDLSKVYVNVASNSCAQGTLEGCNSWIATNVPFKEYIMGVVSQENNTTNLESLKAQFVASKSYTIGRIRSMNRKWHEVNGQYIIYMKGSTDDQVYGDISKLDEETRNRLSNAYDETINDFIIDENNNIAVTQYCSDFGKCEFCVQGNGTCFAQQTANRTTNQTYKEILGYHYSAFNLYDMSNKTIQVSSVSCVSVAGAGSIRLPIDDALSKVTSEYGPRWGQTHSGMDFGFPIGTPIYAIAPGYVAFSGFDNSGYGNYVVLGHDVDSDGLYDYVTLYAHASELLVKTGEIVAGGQQIAKVGSTGKSTGPHLHFGIVKLNGVKTVTKESAYIGAVNPRPYLEDIVNGTSEFNQMIKAERKYYYQNDYTDVAYCSGPEYNGATVANAGCLPTAFAMVVSALKDSTVTPKTVADVICNNSEFKSYRMPNVGTSSTILTLPAFLNKFGISSTHYTSDYEKHIKEELKSGKVLIVNVRNGLFNPSGYGHYFVLVDIDASDKVLVYDPASNINSSSTNSKYHDMSTITSNITDGIWSFK